jgi:signal transduction histidine kinase
MTRLPQLGLRGRLALSIAAIVLVAFGGVFIAVRKELGDESAVIRQGEQTEAGRDNRSASDSLEPVRDAEEEVERTFAIAAGVAVAAALAAGYLLAARTAAPLRRMASTAAAVDAGDLGPRIGPEPSAALEVRTLAEAFDHMLDRLDDAFSRQRQFVSDASHELRTPLTAVRGQLEVLAREDEPAAEEVRRVEASVRVQLERIQRLVDDLLTLAAIDEGVPLSRRRLSAERFLRELAAEEARAVEVGGLSSGTLSGDPERLGRVVRNLLSNARRHAGPRGRVRLSSDARGSRLLVRVDDDGPGIPAAERERVFERFHRVGAARDRRLGGSGLGLAIARAEVELHGGTIRAAESPLGGARIEFELPGFRPQEGTA